MKVYFRNALCQAYAENVKEILENNNYQVEIINTDTLNQSINKIFRSEPNQIKLYIGFNDVTENKITVVKNINEKDTVNIENMIEQIQIMI